MRSLVRSLVLALATAGAVAGCSYLPGPSTATLTFAPVGVKVVTPPEEMRLNVSNSTTIPVMLTVNGAAGRPIAAGQGAELGLADLGPLPWDARVRTESGRVLVELTVNAGDVWTQQNADGSREMKGDGTRVDLSCGQVVVSSGVVLGGPAPGPGIPGDCDP